MYAVQDVIHVNATMWGLFISMFLPPVVGFVTKLNQTPAFKAAVALVVNALGAVIATVIVSGSDAVISKHTVITTFFMYILAHTSYKDFWKSKGITSSYVPVDPAGTVVAPGKLAAVGVKDTTGFVPDKGLVMNSLLITILVVVGIVLGIILILANVDIHTK